MSHVARCEQLPVLRCALENKKNVFFLLILKFSYKHVASILMKFFECERNLEFAFIALVYLLVMCL